MKDQHCEICNEVIPKVTERGNPIRASRYKDLTVCGKGCRTVKRQRDMLDKIKLKPCPYCHEIIQPYRADGSLMQLWEYNEITLCPKPECRTEAHRLGAHKRNRKNLCQGICGEELTPNPGEMPSSFRRRQGCGAKACADEIRRKAKEKRQRKRVGMNRNAGWYRVDPDIVERFYLRG